jgi:hypothetical protein
MSPIVIFFLIVIVIIFVAFVFFKRIILATHILITIGFFLSLIVAVSVLLLPDTYRSITSSLFNDSFFGMQLQNIDNTISDLVGAEEDLKSSIQDFFGGGDSDQVIDTDKAQAELYPHFINLVSTIIRGSLLLLSLSSMIICTYLRYAFAGLHEVRLLEKRVEELEGKKPRKNLSNKS